VEGTISSVVRIPMVITYVNAIKDFSLTRKKNSVKVKEIMNERLDSGKIEMKALEQKVN